MATARSIKVGTSPHSPFNSSILWKLLPRTDVAGVIDAVRNRLLNFLLALKEQHPEVDVDGGDLKSIPKDDVRVNVVNNIYGGQNVIASGEVVHQQVSQGVEPDDLSSLLSALREVSFPEELIGELLLAIDEDAAVRQGGIGPRVSGWLAKIGGNVATNTAAGFATKAILQYYGVT